MRALLALILLATPVGAEEEVIAGLSQSRISISADFDGSELLIFGAIKRESAIDTATRLGVIIAVQGPDERIIVRRKERTALIWVNRDAIEIDAAPSFYAVNTSAPLPEILSATDDLRYGITLNRAIRAVGAPDDVADPPAFKQALMRIRADDGLYQINEGDVALREDTLFQTAIALPANLVEGIYEARIFLTRDGVVTTSYSTAVNVEKVGLERFLYNLAHRQPLLYGLMSLAIAVVAGWGAAAVFRYIKG